MLDRHNPLPRRVAACVATLVWLLWSVPGIAYSQSVGSPRASAGTSWAAQDETAVGSDQKSAAGDLGHSDILDLDIDQLAKTDVVVPSMDIPVTSVSKQESTVGRSPAAVFVITQEMIRRSGATSIPEALRMAPGLEVAHINSNLWAVTSRGFSQRYANKLLVLIDGRTVYNPVFGGVYWDAEDVLLEDVERIEVVRGPGGTIWGANAVNGVISVITKKARDTQGLYASGGGGTHERSTEAVRYGGRLGQDGYYRIYGKYFDRGPGIDPAVPADDAWNQGRVGFRADWNLGQSKTDSMTVQGDYYQGNSGDRENYTITVPPFVSPVVGQDRIAGQNLLARWHRVHDEDSDSALQMYYNSYQRDGPNRFELVDTYDIDYQYAFRLTERQKIICGAGYRHIDADLIGADFFTLHFSPEQRSLNETSQFIQDEITLIDQRLCFYLGVKLDENSFTGLEHEPSARLLWTPDERHSAWGAISRAVHTPVLIFDEGVITRPPAVDTLFPRFSGSSDVLSEDVLAYEIGYRVQATERFSWDIALFYNVYDNLVTPRFGRPFLETDPAPPHMILPGVFTNGPGAEIYGVELAGNWAVSDRWRLYGQYTFLELTPHRPPPNADGVDPHHQVYLRSSWDLREDLELDLIGRYVDNLAAIQVPSYITMDLRLGWRPRKYLELAVVGQNLLESKHLEFNRTFEDFRSEVTQVPRGVYGTITWRR